MLKRILLFASFLMVTFAGMGQFDTSFAKKNITRCADSLVKGFRTRNWELFALYSNPSIIGTLGGKESFIQFINETFATIPPDAWKMYKPGTILQVVKTPTELQSVSELNSIIEWEGKRVTATSYLIGQSWDGGLNWTFFDSQSDINAVKTIKPDISPEIIIPAKKEKAVLIDEKGRIIQTQRPPAPKKRSSSKKPA